MSGNEITLRDQDIKRLSHQWYHSKIGLVQQEPVLFSGTIRDNITYGLSIEDEKKITDEEILETCKISNAYSFISDTNRFPDGLKTLVGERGLKLSGG